MLAVLDWNGNVLPCFNKVYHHPCTHHHASYWHPHSSDALSPFLKHDSLIPNSYSVLSLKSLSSDFASWPSSCDHLKVTWSFYPPYKISPYNKFPFIHNWFVSFTLVIPKSKNTDKCLKILAKWLEQISDHSHAAYSLGIVNRSAYLWPYTHVTCSWVISYSLNLKLKLKLSHSSWISRNCMRLSWSFWPKIFYWVGRWGWDLIHGKHFCGLSNWYSWCFPQKGLMPV